MNLLIFILNSFFIFVKDTFLFAQKIQFVKTALEKEAQALKKAKLFTWQRIEPVKVYLSKGLANLLNKNVLPEELPEELREELWQSFEFRFLDNLEQKLFPKLVAYFENQWTNDIFQEVDDQINDAIERWDAWDNVNDTLQGMISDVLIEKDALINETIQAQIAQKLEAKVESFELPAEMFSIG